jgi:hypothetical protein
VVVVLVVLLVVALPPPPVVVVPPEPPPPVALPPPPVDVVSPPFPPVPDVSPPPQPPSKTEETSSADTEAKRSIERRYALSRRASTTPSSRAWRTVAAAVAPRSDACR